MLTMACSACHVSYTADDLMLSRKKIQKCHVVLEENLDDTGACLLGGSPQEIFASCWLFKVMLQGPQPM
jgi:hypothetical protein